MKRNMTIKKRLFISFSYLHMNNFIFMGKPSPRARFSRPSEQDHIEVSYYIHTDKDCLIYYTH